MRDTLRDGKLKRFHIKALGFRGSGYPGDDLYPPFVFLYQVAFMSKQPSGADVTRAYNPPVPLTRVGWYFLRRSLRGRAKLLLDVYREFADNAGIDLRNAASLDEIREKLQAANSSHFGDRPEQVARVERDLLIGIRLSDWWYAFWMALVPATAAVLLSYQVPPRIEVWHQLAFTFAMAVLVFYFTSLITMVVSALLAKPFFRVAFRLFGLQQPKP